MAILSDYFEPKLLDHIFNRTEFTRPSSLYLGISSSAFLESDNGTTAAAKEPGYDSTTPSYFGDNYSRKQIDNNTQYDVTSTNIKNNSGIDFAEAGGSGWGSIQYWAIFDSSLQTANMLMHGSFTSAVTVSAGSQFRIGTGDLEIIFPTILNASDDLTTPNENRRWRAQVAYRMGFDQPAAIPSSSPYYLEFKDNSTDDAYLYIGVSSTAFGDTLSANENSGAAYTRVVASGSWGDASTDGSGVTTISNTSAISFPEAQSDWGDMAYWAIFRGGNSTSSFYDASSYGGGNAAGSQPLLKGALTTAKTVNSGDVLRFGIGDFVITAS